MAKKVQELQCWQLSDALRGEVHAICAQERVKRHYRFCDGFTEAAGSVCRNISEGFGRFDSGPIVQFFGYALGSLAEVEDYLRDCFTRKFIDSDRFKSDLDLAEHTRASLINFRRYHEAKLRAKKPTRRT